MEQMLLVHFALLLQALHRHGVHHVESDREEGTRHVHAQCHPPQELFVQLLLKVLQHEQTDGEASQGAG